MALPPKSERRETINSLVAGSIAGGIGVLAGQPLDTLKVRMQVGKGNFKHTPGIMALYRGCLPPLAVAGVVSAVNFSAYQNIKISFEKAHQKPSSQLPLYTHAVAGAAAGAILAVLTNPLAIIKVQQQALGEGLAKTASCLVRAEGIRGGLFRGFGSHFVGESYGRGVYMTIYEALKRAQSTQQSNLPPNAQRLLAGAGAGLGAWFAIYPVDVIRSRMFALPPGQGASMTYLACCRLIHAEYGWMGFFRGLHFTLFRAGPVAAVVLPVYDCVYERMQEYEGDMILRLLPSPQTAYAMEGNKTR